ncbi:MAG: flavodoxin [Firmicutes bacterium]|nr:hypothetical protein [Thermoguttaceae bacterium]MBQ2217378.1 flavodoxin [Bacillota bacterium]
MKRNILTVAALLSFVCFAGCGSASRTETSDAQTAPAAQTEAEGQTESAESQTAAEPKTAPVAEAASSETLTEAAPAPGTRSDVLVVYFSATGVTKKVAQRLASVTGGDTYEILAAEPYSVADLNYNDKNSRSTKEQNDKKVRPKIGSKDVSFAGYKTIYLGFPIWWGEEPRILDTFVEKYSFEGITVVPFCTSGSSGIGRSGPNMEELAGSGVWLKGKRFSENVSEADLRAWVDSLK